MIVGDHGNRKRRWAGGLNPIAALGRLREKARRAMATRHLDNNRDMLHDKLRGRITWSPEERIGLVVDGLAVDMDHLVRLLSMHEGWEFELTIKDALK